MCGIAAVVTPSDVPSWVLDAMADTLAHRGPDSAATWKRRASAGVVGFAFRRLAILDLSDAGSQPMFDARGEVALIFNGEIYNYLELKNEIEVDRTFVSRTDTEVLLAAYERWGENCLSRLNGMFAFCVWDGRRQVLFAARDRFGEKPLFYARLPGGGLALASEMKALFAHPELEPRVNVDSVSRYARAEWLEDDEATFFSGVERLPPAHAMTLDASGAITRRWRYWDPDYEVADRAPDDREYIDEFGELLSTSVRRRLRSDVPVGTSLSGGLDSSTIVALLSRHRRENRVVTQNAFSARFDDDPTLSEGPEIDRILAFTGARGFSVTPDADALAAESQLLHWHQEEPFLSASIFAQWSVMRLASANHTTVLLDGQGADELLAGYQYYYPLHQLDLLDRRRLLPLIMDTYRFSRRLRDASRQFPASHRRFNADVALGFNTLARYARNRPAVAHGHYRDGVPAPRYGQRLRRVLAEALQYNSLPMLLRYADRNAMAFGRETRFPFLDYDLVDFCTRLPDRMLVRAGWQKYVLRRATEGLLPPETRWRVDKVGYAAPLDRWLRGPLREWAAARLFRGTITDLAEYDGDHLRALWDAHQAERAEHSWALWRWISLAEWFILLESGTWSHRRREFTRALQTS